MRFFKTQRAPEWLVNWLATLLVMGSFWGVAEVLSVLAGTPDRWFLLIIAAIFIRYMERWEKMNRGG